MTRLVIPRRVEYQSPGLFLETHPPGLCSANQRYQSLDSMRVLDLGLINDVLVRSGDFIWLQV